MIAPIRTTLTALAVCLPFAGLAQQDAPQAGSGTVTGTIGQQDASWTIGDSGDRRTAWREGDGGMEVRLVALPEAGAEDPSGRLTLTLRIDGGVSAPEVGAASVAFRRDGTVWSGAGPNVDVTLSALQPDGDDMAIAGSFLARLTDGDPDALMTEVDGPVVDGNFQATVPAAPATPAAPAD